MQVQIGNKKLNIRWQHHYIDKIEVRIKGQEKFDTLVVEKPRNQRWTKCFISLLKEDNTFEPLVEAIIWCHKEDEYSKCIGRILSLTEAIKLLKEQGLDGHYLDKQMRKSIWDAYSKHTKCGWSVSNAKLPKSRAKDTIQFEL